MLRWMGVRTGGNAATALETPTMTTDDPLAVIRTPEMAAEQVYSVSRSVVLPRVNLKNNCGGGVNPVFIDNLDCTTLPHKPNQLKHPPISVDSSKGHRTVPIVVKSLSSGYGSHGDGSNHEPTYTESTKLQEDTNLVKSILAVNNKNEKPKRPSGSLGSSAAGTLTTIPEGRVDFSIPRPVWPNARRKSMENLYDSLVDDSLLFYTSLSYVTENERKKSADEFLKDLSETINAAIERKVNLTPEQILKCLNDRLHRNTEEEMRKLSMNLRKNQQLNAVMRAFSNNNSTSSGNSSEISEKSSPEWSSRTRVSSSDTDDIYQVPSGSSSSGFSDSTNRNLYEVSQLPVFVHEDLASVRNGVRNAMIYGTLCKKSAVKLSGSGAHERLLIGAAKDKRVATVAPVKGAKSLLTASADEKPSVWELYYGAAQKTSELPYCPAGRPEADFTLDVPRSEVLRRKMKAAKKWRFRCRIVTSFFGLLFFLLSLIAVSLILTRGKRMFGSMV